MCSTQVSRSTPASSCGPGFEGLTSDENTPVENRPEVVEQRRPYVEYASRSPHAAISPDGRLILMDLEVAPWLNLSDPNLNEIPRNQGIYVFDVVSGSGVYPLARLEGIPEGRHLVEAKFFPKDPNRLVTVQDDGKIDIWDISQRDNPRILRGVRAGTKETNDIFIVDAGEAVAGGRARTQSVQINDRGSLLAINAENNMHLLDPRSGEKYHIFETNPEQTNMMTLTAHALSADGKLLAVAIYDTGPVLPSPEAMSWGRRGAWGAVRLETTEPSSQKTILRLYNLNWKGSRKGYEPFVQFETELDGSEGPIEHMVFTPTTNGLITAQNTPHQGFLKQVRVWGERAGRVVGKKGASFNTNGGYGPIDKLMVTRGTHIDKIPSLWVVPQKSGKMVRWELIDGGRGREGRHRSTSRNAGEPVGIYGPDQAIRSEYSDATLDPDNIKILHSGTAHDGRFVWTISSDCVFRVFDVEVDRLHYELRPSGEQ